MTNFIHEGDYDGPRRRMFRRLNQRGADVTPKTYEPTKTYKVRRFFQGDEPTRTIATGLTREEAMEHCNDPETSSSTATSPEAQAITDEFGAWFDGFDEE